MTVKVYLLVETLVGKTLDVANTLRSMDSIESADVVTGPCDIIAVISGADMNEVSNLITGKVHAVQGVVRTITCIVVNNGKVLATR